MIAHSIKKKQIEKETGKFICHIKYMHCHCKGQYVSYNYSLTSVSFHMQDHFLPKITKKNYLQEGYNQEQKRCKLQESLLS